jgi:hypothetical protein
MFDISWLMMLFFLNTSMLESSHHVLGKPEE